MIEVKLDLESAGFNYVSYGGLQSDLRGLEVKKRRAGATRIVAIVKQTRVSPALLGNSNNFILDIGTRDGEPT